MKTATQAANNYKANGGSANTATLWATNLIPALPKAFQNAAANVTKWQNNVGTSSAASAYTKGLAKAGQNTTAIATKINGPAKGTYQTQVQAAGSLNGNYSNFITAYQGDAAAEVATLNSTNPRGTFDDNIARGNAYTTWAHNNKGKWKQ